MIKRPLLWMCIAFIMGIALHKQPMPLLISLAVAGILYAIFLVYFESRMNPIPRMDFFLFLLPVCFFAGSWCANNEMRQMQEKENNLKYVLTMGEEVYTAGTIKQMTKKKNGLYELLLENCVVSSCEEMELDTFFEKTKNAIMPNPKDVFYLQNQKNGIFTLFLSKTEVEKRTEVEQSENVKRSEYVQQNEIEKEKIVFVGDLLVYVSETEWISSGLQYGNKMVCYGEAALFEEATNFGQFDAADYYRQKGITGKVSGIRFWSISSAKRDEKRNEVTQVYEECNKNQAWLNWKNFPAIFANNFQKCGSMFVNWLYECKESLYEVLFSLFDEKEAGVLCAMVLGEKAFLDTELKSLYQESGISHILAVSGLHISLLGMAVYQFVRRTFVGRNGAICIACVFVCVYGLFTNFSISTERAVVMFFLSMFAKLTGKTYDMPTALACSAVVTLVGQPLAIGSASFLLSYTAVIGVCLYQILTKQIKEQFCLNAERTKRILNARFIVVLFETIGVSLCIQFVMLPVLLYFFYEISLYSIVWNYVVLPFTAILLFSGIMTALTGGFSYVAGVFFSGAAKHILAWYEMVCNISNNLPFSLVLSGKPMAWQILLYYVLLFFCIAMFLYRKQKRFFYIACLLGIIFLLPHRTENKLVFLDVSQGDCMILQDKQEGTILIDCGSSDEKQVGTYRLLPYLKANGISTLEAVIATHADADHINGIMELIEKMEPLSRFSSCFYKGTVIIKRLLLPQLANPDEMYLRLEALAQEKNIPIYYISANEQLTFGGWTLVCLYPEKNTVAEAKNNSSLVWYASCGNFDALFTGDVEESGERDMLQSGMLQQYGISNIDLLKVAHHGSKTSSGEVFLQNIQPKFAIISCGKNNRYGHPHEEVVERLESIGSKILNTTDCGQITVKIQTKRGEEGIQVSVWK